MKFNCEKYKTWCSWFAWYPVKVGDNDCRWLETVERRRVEYHDTCFGSTWGNWQYRARCISVDEANK